MQGPLRGCINLMVLPTGHGMLRGTLCAVSKCPFTALRHLCSIRLEMSTVCFNMSFDPSQLVPAGYVLNVWLLCTSHCHRQGTS